MEGRIAALPIHPGTLFWGQPMVQPKNTEIRFNGTVRRFIAARGYGFLTPDPGQGLAVDVLFHETVLRGITDPILPGTRIECFARMEADKGLRVSRILSVRPPLMPTDLVRAKVKFFDHDRGYGFLTREGAPDIFVHATKVYAAGLTTLREGEWLNVRIEQREHGSGITVGEIFIDPTEIKGMNAPPRSDGKERPNE